MDLFSGIFSIFGLFTAFFFLCAVSMFVFFVFVIVKTIANSAGDTTSPIIETEAKVVAKRVSVSGSESTFTWNYVNVNSG